MSPSASLLTHPVVSALTRVETLGGPLMLGRARFGEPRLLAVELQQLCSKGHRCTRATNAAASAAAAAAAAAATFSALFCPLAAAARESRFFCASAAAAPARCSTCCARSCAGCCAGCCAY